MFSAAALRTYLGIWLTDLFYTAKITLNRRANRNKKHTNTVPLQEASINQCFPCRKIRKPDKKKSCLSVYGLLIKTDKQDCS